MYHLPRKGTWENREMSEEKNNMELWDQVCKTDPKNVKSFKGKSGFKGTAIDAQSQRKKATGIWGTFGNEWGIKKEVFEVVMLSDDPHDTIITYSGELYYPDGRFGIHSEIEVWMYVKSYSPPWVKNTDMRKKVRTDAFTKGLSELGFNSDIFENKGALGFDDNKYIAEPENEKREAEPGPINQDKIGKIKKLIKDTGADEVKFATYLLNTYRTAKIEELNTADADSAIKILTAKKNYKEKEVDNASV